MKTYQNYWIILLAFLFIGFTSCSEDSSLDELSVEESELRGGQNGPPGNGNGNGDGPPGNGNGNNGVDLDDIDSDLLTAWADVFLTVDRYAYGMRPNATARAIAYINLAAYETAIPVMREYRSTESKLQGLNISRQRLRQNVDFQLALNTCYADVLHHFMNNVDNNAKDEIDVLEAAQEEELSEGLSDSAVSNSREWGSYVARQVIRYSQTDEEAEAQILEPQPLSYEPPTGDGYWTYSADPERALFPYWGKVRTFAISSDETSSVAPLAYSSNPSSDYYAQMEEVYEVNNEAKATQGEDLWIAEFWSDDVEGLMMSPPGRQVSIAKQLIENFGLDLESSLVMMLKLGFSLNDAAVSTWADKYEHMVMRPNVFIHEYIDPDFQTNLFRLVYWPNPSFPGYPSGHSCFASAAAGVFIDEFGDAVNFTDRTHVGRTEFLGEARTFTTLSEMAEENAFSRIPLGVHIRMDCSEGLRLGYEISSAVNELDLTRNPG